MTIVVSVYRPEASDGPHQSSHQDDYDPFNGVEIFGVFDDTFGPVLLDKLGEIAKVHPNWKFEIDAGPHQNSLLEAVKIAVSKPS